MGDAMKEEFEDELIDDGVALVISWGGSAYERTYQLVFDKVQKESDTLKYPIYLNFASNDLGSFIKAPFVIEQQNKLSFGILNMKSN